MLICRVFIIENLTVRFAISAISVIFKNSAAVTNTLPGNILEAIQLVVGNSDVWGMQCICSVAF